MSLPAGWIAVAAVLALLLGLVADACRSGHAAATGFGRGKTVSLDRMTLTSVRLGLTGRPDRLIKADGTIIVEEWKSARMLRPWHRAQMGVYFVLVEEELRIRPSHGFIVLGDGTRHRIENSSDAGLSSGDSIHNSCLVRGTASRSLLGGFGDGNHRRD